MNNKEFNSRLKNICKAENFPDKDEYVKQLILDLIGEDDEEESSYSEYTTGRNQLKDELRQIVEGDK